MTETTQRRRRERKKTWSAFGDLGRKPNDYEIVTHNMNHTVGETPLEMGPEVHGNVWLKKYRDDISIKVGDWDAFRDPDRVTYDSYVKDQDDQETYVDNLLASYTKDDSIDEGLSSECLSLLSSAMTPSRYLVHAQQMISAYIQQLGPSSYVGNCAAFQVADQLRRVQRLAYRTKQLDMAHPSHGFGSAERGMWESDADWQPMRKAMEQMLVAYKWDEVLVASNMVIRPICDDLFLNQLAKAAKLAGDQLDALILENLYADAKRHNRWTVAAAKFIISSDKENRTVLRELASNWSAAGQDIVSAGASLISRHVEGLTSEQVMDEVLHNWAELKWQAGLSDDA